MKSTVVYVSRWQRGLLSLLLCLAAWAIYKPESPAPELAGLCLLIALLCLLRVFLPPQKAFALDEESLYVFFPRLYHTSHSTYVKIPKNNIKRIELTDDSYFRHTYEWYPYRPMPFVKVIQITVIDPNQVFLHNPSNPTAKVLFDKNTTEHRLSFLRGEFLPISYKKLVEILRKDILKSS